jgi:3-deoxy-D-manno-octulosonic acid kinase
MLSIQEGHLRSAGGGILYDASRLRKPGAEVFETGHWRALGAVQELAGGRASVAIIDTGQERWVLRHYRRGGLIARLSRDRYFWLGEARTRSFAEWRLLAELRRRGFFNSDPNTPLSTTPTAPART